MRIKAAVTHSKGEPFVIEEVELAEPKADEILVKITSCGVCHTDAAVQHQFIPVPLPAVLGHEGCGVVTKIGSAVKEFKVGDKVGISYGYCGECVNCRSGHPAACLEFNNINFGGVMPGGNQPLSTVDGQPLSSFFGQSTFAEYAIVNEKGAFKVEYDDVELALIGPMGCGIQTGAGAVLNVLRPKFGSSIAVFGCGTVGMSAIMAAKIAGCQNIIAVGGNPKSLELAKELGATHTINRKEVKDIPAEVRKIVKEGCNYAIDTSGNADFVKKMLASVGFMGTGVILGATGDVTFNIQNELMGDFKTLIGVVEGDAVSKLFLPKLLEFYRAGKFPFDKLIKFYPFEKINEAFEESNAGVCIKAVLKMD